MKALCLAILLIVGLDEAFDGGRAAGACVAALRHLAYGTERDVDGSVFRQ